MRVLVTGATSGLGHNAAHWLVEHGHAVNGLGRNLNAGRTLQQFGAEFTALDVGKDAGAVGRLFRDAHKGYDWVWHCAALSAPWGKWHDFYSSNILATRHLANAAGESGVQRFVHISTPSVYFDFRHRRDIPESFRARQFANDYAKSKALAEQEIVAAQQRFPQTRYVILRPRGIFGAYDRVLLPRVLQLLAQGNGVLRLPRGGEACLDLTFAQNVVHAMYLASTRPDLPDAAVYNITNQEPVQLKEVLRQLLHEALGLAFQVRAVPYPVLHAMAAGMEKLSLLTGKEPMLTRYSVGALNFDMTLNSHQARSGLGYQPVYSMREAIEITARWVQSEQPSLVKAVVR